jgi:hypothetical protein
LLATRPNWRVARLEKYATKNKSGRTIQVLYKDDNLRKIDGPICLHNDTWWAVKTSKKTGKAILLEPLPHVHDYDISEPEGPEDETAILDLGTIGDALPTPIEKTQRFRHSTRKTTQTKNRSTQIQRRIKRTTQQISRSATAQLVEE